MINQLRIYQVTPDLPDEFYERFKNHAMRIMAGYNFTIISIRWSEADDKLEFVYLLEWSNEATMQKQWAAFMADEEWGQIKQRTLETVGEMVLSRKERTLHLVK